VSIVIDASVALKWVLDEPGQDAADALLDQELVAPALWLVEAANALWRRGHRGEISDEEAEERLAELFNAPVTTVAIEDDLPAAIRLANRLGHPVYDCLYLALALRESTRVVTADARFLAAVQAAPDLAQAVELLGASKPPTG
jgi:predicted nucleic acid-binding protein